MGQFFSQDYLHKEFLETLIYFQQKFQVICQFVQKYKLIKLNEKKNDFFSFFNSSQKKKETKKIIFDENFFNLQVNGGKIHSDKIFIEAISILANEKLEADIKWFQISKNNDFNTLEITGNSYQPSIEDFGSKFMIQVVPIKEGRQYEGMPKSLEIGPLLKDESIQEEIDEFQAMKR